MNVLSSYSPYLNCLLLSQIKNMTLTHCVRTSFFIIFITCYYSPFVHFMPTKELYAIWFAVCCLYFCLYIHMLFYQHFFIFRITLFGFYHSRSKDYAGIIGFYPFILTFLSIYVNTEVIESWYFIIYLCLIVVKH